MALQPINKVEKGLVIFLAVLVDTIGLVPVLGNIVDFVGLVSLNIYFFIKFGGRYLGGKYSGEKVATTLLTGAIGILPVIGNIAPELTLQALRIFSILDKEAKEEAEEAAKKSVANENVPQRKLSRAA